MRTVSAAFSDAEIAQVSEPDLKVHAVLRNVAASIEGSSATVTDSFSTDFPAAGAIDGDATHINFGAAATADNLVGLSGWKSASAATTVSKTTAADWNAGTQTRIKTIDDTVNLALATSRYEQDFESLTAASSLIGQDSWVDGGGAQNIDVETTHAYLSGKGVQLYSTGAAGREAYRAVTFDTTLDFSVRVKPISLAATATDSFEMRFQNGATVRCNIGWRGDIGWFFTDGTTTFYWDAYPALPVVTTWYELAVRMDRTTAASTVLKIFLDGKQVHQHTVDTTSLDRFALKVNSASTAVEWALDDLRFGTVLQDDGTQETVHDLTAAPVSARSVVTLNGENDRTERFVAGAVYGIGNNNGTLAIKDAAARTARAMTFQPSETIQFDSALIDLRKNGTPDGPVWLEIRATSAGAPTATVLARSRSRHGSGLSATQGAARFEFPIPYVLQSGTTYALAVVSDVAADASNYFLLGYHTAGAYTNGQIYTYDGSSWSAGAATDDTGFALLLFNQEETGYDSANRDASLKLVTSASQRFLSQGFKVSYDCQVKWLWVYMGLNSGGSIAANKKVWLEVQSDDGAGKPSNTVLATSYWKKADTITWTTEQWVAFRLPDRLNLTAAVQYHVVAKADYTADATNCLTLGVDNSSASYGDGQRCVSDDAATPAWTATSTSDLCFSVRADAKPWVDLALAYSTDNVTYTSYASVWTNQTRKASSGDLSVTGEAKRYWKSKITFRRKYSSSMDVPWTPTVLDVSVKAVFFTSKTLTVDFGQSRTISRLELFGHPTEGGFRSMLFDYWDGAAWQPFTSALWDSSTFESRKKGGSAATPTVVSGGTFTVTGDYFGANLLADQATSKVRVTIYDNIDEWARVLELKAFRVLDVSDRVTSFNISRRSDFSLLRVQASRINLGLRNDDNLLSPLGSSAVADQVGAGVKLIPWVSYKTATDWLRLGTFYVDGWNEQSAAVEVRVTATDGVKLLKTEVQTGYKTGYKHADIIEYLANLAGVPSTDVVLGKSSSVIDYFVPTQADAYEEIQKIAEAASFSQVFFDPDGYLNFRSVGKTAGSTNAEQVSGLTDAGYAGSSVCIVDGIIYQCFSVKSGSNSVCKLAKFNIATATWTVLGTVSTKASTGFDNPNVGHVALVDRRVLIFNPDTSATGGQYRTDVWEWDIDEATLTQLSRLMDWRSYVSEVLSSKPLLNDSFFVYTFNSNAELTQTNLLILEHSTAAAPIVGGVGGGAIGGVIESANITFMFRFEYGAPITTDVYLYTLDPVALTFTQRTLVGTITETGINIPRLTSGGLAGDGAGTIYYNFGRYGPTAEPIGSIKVYSTAVSSWTQTERATIPGARAWTAYRTHQSTAYIGGYVVGSMQVQGGTLDGAEMFFVYDTATGYAYNIGSPSLSSFVSRGAWATTLSGENYIYALVDPLRMLEIHIGATPQKQTASVLTITSDSAGLLIGSSVEAGDDAAGESGIVNFAVVKSNPLVTFALERVWQADSVPFGLYAETKNVIELEQPCVPGSLTVTATYDQGGAATVTVSQHPQQPILTVTPSAFGRVTSLYLSGTPIRPAGRLLTLALGNAKSINRYGVRKRVIENDYIYDTMTQGLVAQSLVERSESTHIRVKDVKALCRWELELFDRITLVDDLLGINADFYVAGATWDYVSQQMSLEVVKVQALF